MINRLCIITAEVKKIKVKDFVDPDNPTPEELAALAAYEDEVARLETFNASGKPHIAKCKENTILLNPEAGKTIWDKGKDPCRLFTCDVRRVDDIMAVVNSCPIGQTVKAYAVVEDPTAWHISLGYDLEEKQD